MINFKQKILAFCFLFLAGIPVAASVFFVFGYHMNRLRVKAQLVSLSLETISADPASVEWIDDKEVKINGRFFDVSAVSTSGSGMLLLTGLFDGTEDYLNEIAEDSLHNEENRQRSAGFATLLSQLTCDFPAGSWHHGHPHQALPRHFIIYLQPFISFSLATFSPPPEV